MKPQQIKLAADARYRLVLGVALAGLAAGSLVGYHRCHSRTATVQVIAASRPTVALDPNLVKADQAALLSLDFITTQVDVIQSDRVAQRTAQILGMDKDPDAMSSYRLLGGSLSPLAYFGHSIEGSLKVSPSVGSRVITIEYSGGSPEKSIAGANAVAQAYQDVSLELAVSPSRQSDRWYQQNLDDVRAQLNAAQAKLTARQLALGVTMPAGSPAQTGNAQAPEETRLTTLSQNLAVAQASQSNAQAHTLAGALPDALTNPVIQQLDISIRGLQGQRSLLAAHLGPNAQQMREIDSQIAGLQAERAKQAGLVARTMAAAAQQANANVAGLESQLKAEGTRAIQDKAARAELGSLQQDVDALRVSYDNLVAGRAAARLAGSGAQTNVSILAPATQKPCMSAVAGVIFGIAGAVLGALIGIVLAVLLELANRRILTPEDASELLGIPDLGALRLLPPVELPRARRFTRRLLAL